MQTEYFLNACESVNNIFLEWFSNFERQKVNYSQSGSVKASYDVIVERFTDLCDKIFHTAEYEYYANSLALRLLRKLYELVDDHWFNVQQLAHLKEDVLFSDPKWIEICDLAEQTKKALEEFIKKERMEDSNL